MDGSEGQLREKIKPIIEEMVYQLVLHKPEDSVN
jgi:hypothetical protein